MRGAENYDEVAKQSGLCIYRTKGCTSRTALNFHSEATIDDGSCVEPKWGCTLREEGYAGVDPATPSYKGLLVGVNTPFGVPLGGKAGSGPAGGMRPAPFHKAVLNYDQTANAINSTGLANGTSSCVIVIEGCMDPTAVNYDSRANVNSATWCVKAKRGCMMPSGAAAVAKAGILHPAGRDTAGASNYDPLATVNDPIKCIPSRIGCMDQTAANFDIVATVESGGCLKVWPGCLDKTALNFNCSSTGIAPCTADEPRVTLHDPSVCNYAPFPLPPPPSPPLPECGIGCKENIVVRVVFQAAGTVEQVNKTALQVTFAEQANTVDSKAVAGYLPTPRLPWWQVQVAVRAASVIITVDLPAATSVAAADITFALQEVMANASSASLFLGMAVQSTPSLATKVTRIFNANATQVLEDRNPLDELWVQYTMVACVVGVCALAFLCHKAQRLLCPTIEQEREMRAAAIKRQEERERKARESKRGTTTVAVVPASMGGSAKILPSRSRPPAPAPAPPGVLSQPGGSVLSFTASRLPPGAIDETTPSGVSEPSVQGEDWNER